MYYYEVAPNKIVRSGSQSFTYSSDTPLSVGALVVVPIGKSTAPGVVLEEVAKPTYATKPITSSIEPTILPPELLETARWMSEYYATPLATTLQAILPRGLTKTRRPKTVSSVTSRRKRTTFVFTEQQAAAVQQLTELAAGTAILHGITGSGKTAIYIELVRQALAADKSAIVLVPEIALTSQLVAEFSHYFPDILITHSSQTEAERHLVWQAALHSQTPRVVIGPRSALFMPLASIGVIVVDECHEPSFKQEQSPRYSALRVASVLGEHHRAKVIFGSATPSISDYYVAEQTNRPIIRLTKPAQPGAVAPTISLVDMTKRAGFKRHRFLSDILLAAIEAGLANKEQILIFHNRRGTASTTLCENCGWSAGCPRCFVPLTLHADHHHLRCHICDYRTRVPTSCPECQAADIIHKGIGTKLIETELRKLFASAEIARFDGDTDTAVRLENRYQDVYSGAIDIVIGTQVIAKGFDLPHLRLVGIVQADAGLSLPDYSASERTFQLLSQAIGRVGRSHHPTRVIVQSYQPDHPAITDGIHQNYPDFYRRTIAQREKTLFPPFCYLLKLTCVYKTEATAIKQARQLAETLQTHSDRVTILGPTPAFYERSRDTYRWQIVAKSRRREELVALLEHVPPQHWQYELDPVSLL